MELAVMPPTHGDCKLVADLAAERSALCKAQVMGIRWVPRANQAGLLGHISYVVPVANSAWLRQCQYAFIDQVGARTFLRSVRIWRTWRRWLLSLLGRVGRIGGAYHKACQFRRKGFIDTLSVRCR